MSNYVTHDELNELMQGLLSGISGMFDAQEKNLERMESQIMMRIENGVEKKVDLLAEKVDGIEQRLISVEADVKEIKTRLDRHDAEIYTLKRIK